MTKKRKQRIIKVMETRDILKPFKPLERNRDTRNLLKLLPILSFIFSSVLFIFPLPVLTVPAGSNAPSMSGTGYSLQTPHYKRELTFSPTGWVLPAVSCFLALYFIKSYFAVSRLLPKKRPVSSGIRAPPHH
ncbi:MAG: hypothetical protein GY950_03225 [bacterium]|nr:hypothetical protein [bacterium]